MGLRCRNPPRHLSQLKARAIPLIYAKWERTLVVLRQYFSWDIYRNPHPLQKKNQIMKVDIWHPAVGLRFRNPTQAFNSVKEQDQYLYLWPQVWARTLPSFGIFFMRIFIETPTPPQKKIEISKLIFDTLLWAWGAENPPRHLSQ